MAAKNKTETPESNEPTNEATNDAPNEFAAEFEFDDDVMGNEFDTARVPRFPYGIAINDKPAGLFLTAANLAKAGWIGSEALTLTELQLGSGDTERGLFLEAARMSVLGNVPPYIRYKRDKQLGQLAGALVGSYTTHADVLDKKTMDVCSEHLMVFFDSDNQPLHAMPISVRLKNTALWMFRERYEEFCQQAEMAFAKATHQRYQAKAQRWLALCVFDVAFTAVKKGQNGNQSWCLDIAEYKVPQPTTLPLWFLGIKQMRSQKALLWENYDFVEGSGSTRLMLAAAEETIAD